MGEISESGKDQSLVGTDPFGLTENNVLEAIEKIKKDIDNFRSALKDPDENYRRAAQSGLQKKESELQILARLSAAEIVSKIKSCYDKVVELAGAGSPKKEIIARIRAELPDIMDYYSILREEAWGYRLGQAIEAARVENTE